MFGRQQAGGNVDRIRLTKMVAQGNDLLIADARHLGVREWSRLAREICSRHNGLGSDGLVVLSESHIQTARYQMFNPDGTEDFCVNGLACASVYMSLKECPQRRHFSFETKAGIRNVSVLPPEGHSAERTAVVDVGRPGLCSLSHPTNATYSSSLSVQLHIEVLGRTAVVNLTSTGVPHAVIFTEGVVSEDEFLRLSPLIERHSLLVEDTCVIWTQSISREILHVRIWERGVGETLSCGSGICAAAAVSYVTGRTGKNVTVTSRGGQSQVTIDDAGAIHYTVSVSRLFEADIE